MCLPVQPLPLSQKAGFPSRRADRMRDRHKDKSSSTGSPCDKGPYLLICLGVRFLLFHRLPGSQSFPLTRSENAGLEGAKNFVYMCMLHQHAGRGVQFLHVRCNTWAIMVSCWLPFGWQPCKAIVFYRGTTLRLPD